MFKKMPRMDTEIKLRYETLFALTMNHMDFQLNFDVFKKVTDKESPHYKCIKDLFKKMTIFSYSKKFIDMLKDKEMPEDWVTDGYGDPTFIHGEDEEDITKLMEKLRFRDESKDEFEELLNGEDISAKDEALEEILFEVVFRKANRNYSFMEKVLEHYDSTLKTQLKNKKNTVKMMVTMFKSCPARLVIFIEMFANHKIFDFSDVTEWILEQDKIEEIHVKIVNHILNSLIYDENYSQATKMLEDLKKIVEKASDQKDITDFTLAILRMHQPILEEKGKFEDVKKMFEGFEQFKELMS